MPQPEDHGEKSEVPLNSCNNMLLALGGNLTSSVGAPEMTLREALKILKLKGAVIRSVSPFYNTPAYPDGNGPDYVNAAADIRATWSPEETLAVFHEIENEMGRQRETRWGQRTLDLDLIACGDVVLPDPATHKAWRTLSLDEQMRRAPAELVLPHPRLQDRAFVLVPLADVAPDWVHPVSGKTVTEMRAALDPEQLRTVRPLVS